MKQAMRRQNREIPTADALAILERGEYGVLSSVSVAGQPYGVPVSYVMQAGCIDFHSATEGHKITNFEHNDLVSFCVVGQTNLLPDKFSTEYESVIVFGRISERLGREKIRSLQALVAKYSPDHIATGDTYIEASEGRTRVFSISLDQITGKARTTTSGISPSSSS